MWSANTLIKFAHLSCLPNRMSQKIFFFFFGVFLLFVKVLLIEY